MILRQEILQQTASVVFNVVKQSVMYPWTSRITSRISNCQNTEVEEVFLWMNDSGTYNSKCEFTAVCQMCVWKNEFGYAYLACSTLCCKAFCLQNPQQTDESFMCIPLLPLLCFVPARQALQGRLCRWAAKTCQSMLESNTQLWELERFHCCTNHGNPVPNCGAAGVMA